MHLLRRLTRQGVNHRPQTNASITKAYILTPGPHLGPLVAQQISVLHMLHLIQSQPSFLTKIILHIGQCMASPPATIF